MRIQHNIMAMSAYRNYTNNVSAMKKNLEKLSSGYKINRAGDDAAGLAISEKMRAQITGLETAQKNAKDGISLVQTAEGALTEVHDMLNRMVELATQSANGTYDNTTDRAQMQKEMNQLRSEIDRIADSSNFNGIKLLNGDMDGADKITESPVEAVTVTGVADGDQDAVAGTVGVYEIDLNDLVVFNGGTAGQTIGAEIKIGGTAIATITGGATGATVGGASAVVVTANSVISIKGISYNVTMNGGKITLTGVSVPGTAASYPTTAELDVTLDLTTGETPGTANNGYDLSVHVKTPPQVDGQPKLAQGSFTLNKADIADGAKLTIGNNTYVFAVGKDSTAKAGDGETLIDLTDMEADNGNLLRAAAHKLTQQDNAMFHITTNNVTDKPTSVTIHLTEKEGAVDYKTDWDLKGGTGNSDGKWNEGVDGGKYDRGVVTKQAAPTTTPGDKTKGLTLQIGDTADSWNQLKVNIGDMHCSSLGIETISIADQDSAAKAVDAIKAAINKVSDVRGTLGATQNRLEHTINNLSVMTENIQDAESTIRDVDVAEEMMAYTKNNILIQSAQAMLAQANQVPQGVLQLLQ